MAEKASGANQDTLWSARAAERHRLVAGAMTGLWGAMLDAAGVTAGSRFLDAGCGSGGASSIAAGRGARISGIDVAKGMVELARSLVPAGHFVVGDLLSLPWPDASFDCAIACNSVHFTADPPRALAELRRVCVPGGAVAVCCLGLPEECESSVVHRAVRALYQPRDGGAYQLSGRGVLDGLMACAGFRAGHGAKVDVDMRWDSFDTAVQAQLTIGPVQEAMGAVGEARVVAALREALGPYLQPDGTVRLRNLFRYVTGVA